MADIKRDALTERQQLVLAVLAPAKAQSYTPVQVQKLFFLIDEKIPDVVGGPHFDFEPFNYGPFDKAVYEELEYLAFLGLVEMGTRWNWTTYRLTQTGQELGETILRSWPPPTQRFTLAASDFVRGLSFQQLVSAIYKAYPNMRANSVFQEPDAA